MLYEVILMDKNIVSESKGLFENYEDAKMYTRIHKVELDPSTNYHFTIVSKDLDRIENLPNTQKIVVQTYAEDNTIPFSMENRYWSLEEVTTDVNPRLGLDEGTAAVFPDDKTMLSSYTIIFPVSTKALLEEKLSREYLIDVAKNILLKRSKDFTKDRKTNASGAYTLENFNISDFEEVKC